MLALLFSNYSIDAKDKITTPDKYPYKPKLLFSL
jgi:hypothetical protein